MKIVPNEKGVTLIELLITTAILGAIAGVMSMAIITIIKTSSRSNDWAITLNRVQNAGYWISRDVQMSQGNIDIYPDPDIFLTLEVPEWDEVLGEVNDERTIDYQFINYQFEDRDEERWLVRIESIGESIVGETVIAQYISEPIQYDYDPDSDEPYTLTFTITATSGNVPVTRDYEAMQRVPAPSP